MVAMLRHGGRRASTQKSYCREMRRFLEWLGHDRPLRASRADVVAYLEHKGDGSVCRRKMAHAALRFFYLHVANRSTQPPALKTGALDASLPPECRP